MSASPPSRTGRAASLWSAALLSACADEPAADTAPAACADLPALTSGTYSLEDQGITRTYRVFAPDTLPTDQPAPVILAFHGWGGDEGEFLDVSVVTSEAAARGYVVVAPLGLGPGEPDRSPASWAFRGSSTGVDPAGDPICDPADSPD